MKFLENLRLEFCGYASGLICFRHTLVNRISKENEDTVHVICNPSTRQRASLPELRKVRDSKSFLGFGPIDKHFKVLVVAENYYRILTLGTGKMSWRKIQCPLTHDPHSSPTICINGVLYYFASFAGRSDVKIVCFDVSSEKFKFIDVKFNYVKSRKLVCIKGKLCVITLGYGIPFVGRRGSDEFVLRVLVLEDFEKQEWSKHAYTLPETYDTVKVVGVTATCEIVLLAYSARAPFYVLYFNPERNTLQRFEIKDGPQVFGITHRSVHVFVDHVEDFTFNIKDYQQRDRLRFESINNFDALCLSDDD